MAEIAPAPAWLLQVAREAAVKVTDDTNVVVNLPADRPEPMADDKFEILLDLPLPDDDQSRRDFCLACYCRSVGWTQTDAWAAIIRDGLERRAGTGKERKPYNRRYIAHTLAAAWAAEE